MVGDLLGATISLLLFPLAVGLLGRSLRRFAQGEAVGELRLGLLAALLADAPELTGAVVGLATGRSGLSTGVVVGACSLNLVGIIGYGLLRRPAARQRPSLGPLLAVLLGLVGALACGSSPLERTAALLCLVGGLLWLGRGRGGGWRRPGLGRAVGGLLVAGGAVVGVATAFSLFLAALGSRAGLGPAASGALLLAPVSAAPNLWAGIVLWRLQRGGAAVAECLDSNSINLLGGLVAPGLLLGLRFAKPPLLLLGGATILFAAAVRRKDPALVALASLTAAAALLAPLL